MDAAFAGGIATGREEPVSHCLLGFSDKRVPPSALPLSLPLILYSDCVTPQGGLQGRRGEGGGKGRGKVGLELTIGHAWAWTTDSGPFFL